MDRHWDENTKVLVWQVQLPLETATLCNYGKTLMGIMLIFGVGCTGTNECGSFQASTLTLRVIRA